ncbi:MAG: MFS transporter [Thermoanaerobaculia bacterium]
MAPDRVSLGRLWALMATVFVDMIGLLMVVPVLPLYAKRLGADAFVIGLMVSVFAVAQLASAPLWGRFSDRHGRRPMIMIGVTISIFAYLLFAFACSEEAMRMLSPKALVGLLFLSRLVQGAGGATTGVVQAYVGDSIVPEERAKALGWISAATSAGVMLGPALGSLAATLGPAAPGLAATVLCLVNLLFCWKWLPESHAEQDRAHRDAPRASLRKGFWKIVTEPRAPVARLIWIYAIGMMAFMAMNAILALFLQDRYGVTEKSIGYFYTYVGTISLVMRSLILGPTVRRFGETRVMQLGLVALVLGFALQPLAGSIPVFALVVLFIPIGTALLFPATSSLVTRFGTRSELGATMGVQQAFGGVARLIGPIWAGAAFEYWGSGSPMWISAGLALLTFLFARGLQDARANVAPAPVTTPS